ncbi:hypothetical protein [Edaphobacter aggregans]|uniref:hypothetical protein n=1 Tax=Edaphobacter aggregans TaxID=570835 RepID=UPI0005543F3A|nr:hypothetical protein [Edaphobacter aggregans]
MPTDAHLYKIRDKHRFLIAAMRELAGTARISFEGDLSATAVAHLAGASADETEILKRNTLWPKQDFVVLPLETDLVEAIIAAVGGTVPGGILHIQIEKGNRLELGLYDNCAPKASFFGPSLTPSFFANLQGDGIISQWTEG